LSTYELGAGGHEDEGGAAPDEGVERLARIVFAVVVLASVGAFFLTQALKHAPTVVQDFKLAPSFEPYPGGHTKTAALSFRVQHSDRVTVAIIDTSGNVVATLVHDRPISHDAQFSLRWNGRRGNAVHYETLETAAGHEILVALPRGRLAAPGEYRVEVRLLHQHKTVRFPTTFTLRRP